MATRKQTQPDTEVPSLLRAAGSTDIDAANGLWHPRRSFSTAHFSIQFGTEAREALWVQNLRAADPDDLPFGTPASTSTSALTPQIQHRTDPDANATDPMVRRAIENLGKVLGRGKACNFASKCLRDREMGPTAVFDEHGLMLHWSGGYLVDAWLVHPGHDPRPWHHQGEAIAHVWQSHSGAFWVSGDHWQYIEKVFTPWLLRKTRALEEGLKTQHETAQENERRALQSAIDSWAQARAPFRPQHLSPISPPAKPEVELDLDDDRETLLGF